MDTITHHSIRAAVSARVARYIEKHGLVALGRRLLWFFGAGLLTSLAVNASGTLARLGGLIGHNGYLPVRYAMVYGLVLASPRIVGWFRHLLDVWAAAAPVPRVHTIEGMPAARVVDHLTTHGTFKRDDVKAAFQVPQYRVERLTKKLKDLGVLVTGENGMSVLDPAWSAEDLAQLFDGKAEASELTALFRRDGAGLTSRPRAADDSPPPAVLSHGFTSKKLAPASHATEYAASVPAMRSAYAAACA